MVLRECKDSPQLLMVLRECDDFQQTSSWYSHQLLMVLHERDARGTPRVLTIRHQLCPIDKDRYYTFHSPRVQSRPKLCGLEACSET